MMKNFIEFFTDHFIISMIWIVLFIAVVYITILCWYSNNFELSCYEVVRLINQKESVIVDIRDQNYFYQGHIINSIHLPASNIRASCAGELYRFKKGYIIIVCSDGILSFSIVRFLYKLGFKQVYFLKGGISEWSNGLLPLVNNSRSKK